MILSFVGLLTSWPYSLLATCVIIVILVLAGLAVCLIHPILFPRIVTYPWHMPDAIARRNRDKKLTVVFAGSYNPPHNGHLAMLRYLSDRFGQVIVVIGFNPDKEYAVLPQDRQEMTRRMLRETSANNVQVKVVEGYIWRHVKPLGAKVFVRGIRSWEKDGHDERNLQILNTWGPLMLGPLWWPLPTMFLEGKPEYNHVSSTLIRDICQTNSATLAREELSRLVPRSIADDVARLYALTE